MAKPTTRKDLTDRRREAILAALKPILAAEAPARFRNPDKYKLCLILDGTAYFTTQPIGEQTGDDWDDIPYHCNAGAPYEDDGKTSRWHVFKLQIGDGELLTPSERNMYASVDKLKNSDVPWLHGDVPYHDIVRNIDVYAGCALPLFIDVVSQYNPVYLPIILPAR